MVVTYHGGHMASRKPLQKYPTSQLLKFTTRFSSYEHFRSFKWEFQPAQSRIIEAGRLLRLLNPVRIRGCFEGRVTTLPTLPIHCMNHTDQTSLSMSWLHDMPFLLASHFLFCVTCLSLHATRCLSCPIMWHVFSGNLLITSYHVPILASFTFSALCDMSFCPCHNMPIMWHVFSGNLLITYYLNSSHFASFTFSVWRDMSFCPCHDMSLSCPITWHVILSI